MMPPLVEPAAAGDEVAAPRGAAGQGRPGDGPVAGKVR